MILRSLLAHYRRHPLQALFLLTGIVVANVLLVGTLLINAPSEPSVGLALQAEVPSADRIDLLQGPFHLIFFDNQGRRETDGRVMGFFGKNSLVLQDLTVLTSRSCAFLEFDTNQQAFGANFFNLVRWDLI